MIKRRSPLYVFNALGIGLAACLALACGNSETPTEENPGGEGGTGGTEVQPDEIDECVENPYLKDCPQGQGGTDSGPVGNAGTGGGGGTVETPGTPRDLALEAAQTALKKCRDDGFQVAVVVVDRFGQPQVLLRDRYAGLPAADIATAKAYTALSFRRDTSELAKMVRDGQMDANLARMPHIAMLAGALVIETGGTLVGGIGVSGAPGGDKDEACARAGLDAIRDKLDF